MTPMKLFLAGTLAAICLAPPGPVLAAGADADSTVVPEPVPVAPVVETTAAPVADTTAAAPAPNTSPAQAAPAAAGTQVATPEPSDRDGGWPRLTETVTGATLIMYQPQAVSWERQRELVAMAALSYLPKNATKPDLGTVTVSAQTSVSMEERMVKLEQVKIVDMKFATLDKTEAREALAEIQKAVPATAVFMGLDRLLAMVDKSQIRGSSVQVQTDPPPIFYSEKPAVLLQFDGPPIMATIEKGTLKYGLNTNWDVLQDPETKTYYMRNGTGWFQAPELKGPWKVAGKLPKSFDQIPANDNWKETKDNIPGKKAENTVVFYSERPAELLLLEGKPKLEKVEGTQTAGKKGSEILWVKNTESDLFRMKDADYYYLVSGRWFSAAKPEGPWKFATQSLPPAFMNFPMDHERARIRSSIPGTDEAAEAVLLAQVPQTARVDAKSLKPASVAYDGEPKFEPIEGAPGVTYAVNTESDVFVVDGKYYLCQAGVWFSAQGANGPWSVATSVPDAIYKIPSSSSAHHVTYVTVVDDDADYPTYGYTPGYMGVTIAFGCAMYGTGYYYPPYYGYPGGYPIYYPRPVCYGGGAMYNPRTGAYGHYQSAYGPYGGVARGATYNPSTGTYKRGAMAYGPTGAQGYAQAYNPRTGTYASTRQGSNPYGSWGSSHVQRGDDWVNTQRVTDSQGNSKWAAQGSGGGSAAGVRTGQGGAFVGEKNGDMYAGKDGNVYRKTDGGWQSYDNGGWNDVQGGGGARPGNQPAGGAGASQRPSTQPGASQLPAGGAGASQRPATQPGASTRPSPNSSTMGQLDRDAQGRNQGSQRTKSSYGGSSSPSRGSSSGSRGGGSRGGGGRGGGGRR